MAEPQYYSKYLTLPKDFLIKTHAHPLLTDVKGVQADDPFYIEMWASTPDPYKHVFGGLSGEQYSTLEEIKSFLNAYSNILLKHNIATKHGDELLYFILFYEEESEHQSQQNNTYNNLLDYTRFILDIWQNTENHIAKYRKNKLYKEIKDHDTEELLFVKQMLFDKYTEQQICEARPSENVGDIISYRKFSVGVSDLLIPKDLTLILSPNDGMKTKNFHGEEINIASFPQDIQNHVLKFALDYMINAHKLYNSKFYQAITTTALSTRDFKNLYEQYKRKAFRPNNSLIKIGTAISDYLAERDIIKTKRAQAFFLLDYFALFKVLRIKTAKPFPVDYQELSSFYIQNKVNGETIRMIMKEGIEIGEI